MAAPSPAMPVASAPPIPPEPIAAPVAVAVTAPAARISPEPVAALTAVAVPSPAVSVASVPAISAEPSAAPVAQGEAPLAHALVGNPPLSSAAVTSDPVAQDPTDRPLVARAATTAEPLNQALVAAEPVATVSAAVGLASPPSGTARSVPTPKVARASAPVIAETESVATVSSPAAASVPSATSAAVKHAAASHAATTQDDAADEPFVAPVWKPLPGSEPTSVQMIQATLPARPELPKPTEERRFSGIEAVGASTAAPLGGVGASEQTAATTVAAAAAALHQTAQSTERAVAAPAAPVVANPVERVVVQQVSRALIRRNDNGDRSLVIRLTPPELGTVRVEITERDGQLTARIHADDPAVRQALERLLPQVRSDLRSADSSLQHISLEPAGSSAQNFDGRGFDGRGSPQQSPQQRSDQASNQRGRRGDRPVFSLAGGIAPLEAEPVGSVRPRVASGLIDTLA